MNPDDLSADHNRIARDFNRRPIFLLADISNFGTSMTTPANTGRSQSAARYGGVAIILHWTIAAAILCNVALAWCVDALPDDWVRPAIDTHKSIGITALGLVLLRILWRISHQPPRLPDAFPKWERTVSHIAHGLLYLIMLGLPISGWLHDSAWKDAASHPMTLFHLVPWPRVGFLTHLEPQLKEHMHDVLGAVHAWFAYALYLLLALHLTGVLKHALLDRQSVLRRMWP
jgi:cytochrome b561